MTLRPEYALGHSEFNAFLFASVGEEESGLELTVLSALARLDLDPWGEAARLSALPREAATRALTTSIAALPAGKSWNAADARTIAARLVRHLPRGGAKAAGPPQSGAGDARKQIVSNARKWLFWGAVAATVIVVGLRLQAEKAAQPGMSEIRSGPPPVAAVAPAARTQPPNRTHA